MIQLRRDTAANWTSANPVLGAGQPGVETDTQLWKVGDGVTAWAALDYMGAVVADEVIDDRVAALVVAGTNMTITYNDGAGTLTFDATGGGVTDGDKGDVVVSGGGAVSSIDYTAVNAVVAPVWGNITSKPAAVTALSGTNTGDQTTIVGITGTKAQFDTAVTDGNVQWVGDAPTAHTHLLAAGATDVTVTAANLNALDDGVNTALHFHDADRARAVHTGTQLAATISDFDAAVAANAAVTANTAKVTNATHTGDVTGATALTIAADAVTFAKMQNASAASVLVGRGQGGGAGDLQEITLGTNLSMTGTVLNATGGGGGGGNAVAAVLAFGAGFTDKAQTVVTGQAWVAADSKITLQVLTPAGVDPDEMYLLNFRPVVSDLVVATGFTVTLYSEAEASGNYTVNCIGV